MSRTDNDAMHDSWVQAVEKGDPALIASFYAPDAHLLPPGMPAVEASGLQAFFEQFLGMGITGARLESVRYEEGGDIQVAEGRYQLLGGSGVLDTGKYVDVAKRQPDGSLKMIIDIFNSDQAPATA